MHFSLSAVCPVLVDTFRLCYHMKCLLSFLLSFMCDISKGEYYKEMWPEKQTNRFSRRTTLVTTTSKRQWKPSGRFGQRQKLETLVITGKKIKRKRKKGKLWEKYHNGWSNARTATKWGRIIRSFISMSKKRMNERFTSQAKIDAKL